MEEININDYYKQGLELYNKQQYEESKEIFSNILEKFPNNPQLYIHLYNIYCLQEDYKNALIAIEKLLSFPEQDILEYRLYLIKVYIKLELYSKCRNSILFHLIDNKENPELHLLMCELAEYDKDIDLYIDLYKSSAMNLIRNNNGTIKTCLLLLLLTCKEQNMDNTIQVIDLIVKEYVNTKTNLEQFKIHIINHTYKDIKYRYALCDIFKTVNQIKYVLLFFFQYSLTNDDTDDNKMMIENIDILYNKLHYESITDLITDFEYPINNLYHYKNNNTAITNKLNKLFLNICPNINFTAPHIQKSIKPENNIIHIGFISTTFHETKSSTYYLFYKLIESLTKNDTFKISLLLFEPIDGNSNDGVDFSNNAMILNKDHLEKSCITISNLELDYLFYLDLNSDIKTLILSMMRLAKIQINMMGYLEISGISTIDNYLIGDLFIDSTPQIASIKKSIGGIYPIIDKYLLHYPYSNIDYIFPHKSTIYICPHSITCFNTSYLNIIINILEQDNYAILILNLSNQHYKLFLNKIETILGSNQSILTQIKCYHIQNDIQCYCKLLSKCHIYLDTHPNGGNLRDYLIALNYGIPIINVPSNIISGRLCYMLYNYMEIEDLNILNGDDYIAIALQLSNNKKFYKEIKDKLLKQSKILFNNYNESTLFTDYIVAKYNKYNSDNPKEEIQPTITKQINNNNNQNEDHQNDNHQNDNHPINNNNQNDNKPINNNYLDDLDKLLFN